MSYFAGLLSGLDQRRREERERATKEADSQQDREISLLMQLAQGDDPEIASIAGAGLLETLSGNRKVTNAKGLRGFLGEVDRSSYLPQIRAAMQARGTQPQTPGTPGGAALPGASPVEPKAQGAGAGQPPMLEMPMVSRQGLGVAPTPEMPAVSQAGLGVAGMGAPGAAGGSTPAPLGAAMAGPPALPENAQQRYQRLFPSASEVAQRTKVAELMARFQAATDALRGAKTPDERNMIMAMNGAPQAQLRPAAYNVRFINEMGMEDQGVGVMEADGTMTVDGRPVRPVEATPVNQRGRAPQHVDRKNPETGLMERVYFDADTMQQIRVEPLNTLPSVPPQFEGAPVRLGNGGMGAVRRGTAPDAPPEVVQIPGAVAPPRGSTRPQDPKKGTRAREAAAFLKDVRARINEKAKAGKNLVTGALGVVNDRDKDEITKEVTGGSFTSYAEILRAEQGLEVGAPPAAPAGPAPGAFGSPEGAAAILSAIKNRSTARKPDGWLPPQ